MTQMIGEDLPELSMDDLCGPTADDPTNDAGKAAAMNGQDVPALEPASEAQTAARLRLDLPRLKRSQQIRMESESSKGDAKAAEDAGTKEPAQKTPKVSPVTEGPAKKKPRVSPVTAVAAEDAGTGQVKKEKALSTKQKLRALLNEGDSTPKKAESVAAGFGDGVSSGGLHL